MMDKRYLMLIDALDGTPRDLTRLVKPLQDADGYWRPSPTDWSVAIVVAHLSYIEGLMLARYRRMIELDHPDESALEPNEADHIAQAQHNTLAALLGGFTAKRAETSAYLATLTQPQWLRTCNHTAFGAIRVRKMVEIQIGHDNEHLAQIVDIREKLRMKNAQ